MTRKEHRYMDEAAQLELHLEHQTELFLCGDNSSYDSEWRLYDYDADGTRKTTTYEVTEETPPNRSVILKNWDTGEEFEVSWSVTVTKRSVDKPAASE